MYLPEEWLTPAPRAQAQIPATVRFAPKWQLALTLLRQVRAAGFTLTAVVGDAEFGDNATLRRTLHRAQLPYALGVSSDLKVFLGTPRARIAAAAGRQRASAHAPAVAARHPDRRSPRLGGPADASPVAAGVVAQWHEPPVARPLLCGPGHARPRLARASARARGLAAVRTRPGGHTASTKYYLVDLPSTASLRAARAARASALGDRAAIPGTQRRNRARPLRRPQPARVATTRRLDRASRTAFSRSNAADAVRRI